MRERVAWCGRFGASVPGQVCRTRQGEKRRLIQSRSDGRTDIDGERRGRRGREEERMKTEEEKGKEEGKKNKEKKKRRHRRGQSGATQ